MKRKAKEEVEKQAEHPKVEAVTELPRNQLTVGQTKQQAQEQLEEKTLEAKKVKLGGEELNLGDREQAVDEQYRVANQQMVQIAVDAKQLQAKQLVQRNELVKRRQLAKQDAHKLVVQRRQLTTQKQELSIQKEQVAFLQDQLETKQVDTMEVQQPQLATEQLIGELRRHLQTMAEKFKKFKLQMNQDLDKESSRREVDMTDWQLEQHMKLAITRTHQLGRRYPTTGLSTGWPEAASAFISIEFGRLRDARPALSPSELVQCGEKLWSLKGEEERREWFNCLKWLMISVKSSVLNQRLKIHNTYLSITV